MRAISLFTRAYPALALTLFFVTPLVLLLGMSFLEPSSRVRFLFEGTWDNYAGFFDSFYLSITWRSIWITGLAAALVIAIIFPALLIITDLSRRWQSFWIMTFLSLLCLSEVVIGFSWKLLLLKSTGAPGWLEDLGIALKNFGLIDWTVGLKLEIRGYSILRLDSGFLQEMKSWDQSLGAIQLGLFTLGVSIAGLLMYPQIAGRDRSLEEAAKTLGTPPYLLFFRLVVPVHATTLISTFVALYVYLLGAYSVLKLLGSKSDHLTLVWRIYDRAGDWDGLPEAAALSIILLLITGVLLLIPMAINRLQGTA